MEDFYLNNLRVLHSVFTPSAPIEDKDIFFGRAKQIQKCMDAVAQKGRHVVLYGERGVGKTSFANVMRLMLHSDAHPIKLTCDTHDTVESIWKKVFDRIIIRDTEKIRSLGFGQNEKILEKNASISEIFNGEFQLRLLDRALQIMPKKTILIFDEFDRLNKDFDKAQLVDHIKNISDNYTEITLFFVGIGDTVNELIAEHSSLERNLMQIHLPVMEDHELKEICSKGVSKVGIHIKNEIVEKIVKYSCGFPHFTHLLSLNSCKIALMEKVSEVSDRHFRMAIQQSVEETHESLNEAYQKATLATKENIYSEVLLACSLAPLDVHNTFQASELTPILSKILGKEIALKSFLYHLGKFCTEDRGNILTCISNQNIKRYRFSVQSMRAFIGLRDVAKKL